MKDVQRLVWMGVVCLVIGMAILSISGCIGQDFVSEIPENRIDDVCKIVDGDGVSGGVPFMNVTGKVRSVTVIGCKDYNLSLKPSGEIEIKTK